MRHIPVLILAVALIASANGVAQTVKRTSARTSNQASTQRKSTATAKSPAQSVSNGEISQKGHIDGMILGPNNDGFPVGKDVKADYIFNVFIDPTDRSAPARKTVVITLDVDWKALGGEDMDISWSWSGKRVNVVKQNNAKGSGYAIMEGNSNVANILYMKTDKGNKTFVSLTGKPGLTGLKQGMYVDDLARQVQAEVPGTRVVITGNVKNGLTEYVLLSFGESKVYDVTGDYHYELNNREPYFTFWFDKDKKLVKWFKLK